MVLRSFVSTLSSTADRRQQLGAGGHRKHQTAVPGHCAIWHHLLDTWHRRYSSSASCCQQHLSQWLFGQWKMCTGWVHLSPAACLLVCLFAWVPAWLPISTCLTAHLPVCLPCLHTCMCFSVCLPACLSVHRLSTDTLSLQVSQTLFITCVQQTQCLEKNVCNQTWVS